MDKKRSGWRLFIKSSVKTLTLSSLMLGGAGAHVWGAEWLLGVAYSAASHLVGGATQTITTTAWSFLEKEKTYENLFNEAIASSKRSEAEEVVRKVFAEIRSGLKELNIQNSTQLRDKIIGNSNIEKYNATFQIWYTKYRLGMLMLDYTEAFRVLCDSSCQTIEELVPKVNSVTKTSPKEVLSQRQYLEKFQKEILERKVKIGAKLYYSYRYDRGGGMRDRFVKHSQTQLERKRLWGVSYFDPQPNIFYDEVFELYPGTLTEHVCVNDVREAYRITLNLLSSQTIICSEQPEKSMKLLEKFMREFSSVFPERKLFSCQLNNLIFEEEERKVKSKERPIQIEKRSSSSGSVKAPRSESNTPVKKSKAMSVPKKMTRQSRDEFPVSPSSKSSHLLLGGDDGRKSTLLSKRTSLKIEKSDVEEEAGYSSNEESSVEERELHVKKGIKTEEKPTKSVVSLVKDLEDEGVVGEISDENLKGDDEGEVKDKGQEDEDELKPHDYEGEDDIKSDGHDGENEVKSQRIEDDEKLETHDNEAEPQIRAEDLDLSFSFDEDDLDILSSAKDIGEKLPKGDGNKDK